ncbi:MAG TPA: hypothetical protein VK841_18965 [Polyangiaceae bacterium]|jgi:hypothetical protein|nr:hypothetical protein [Polyangiaceae bacterium]
MMKISLEQLLTSPDAFGLTTATPLQRAICRIADGLPLGELASCTEVVDAIGDTSALPAGTVPLEVYLLSGIRTAKSLIAAALAVRAALTCDLSRIRPGEPVRVSVLSLTRDLADVIMRHIVGTLESKPMLRPLIVGSPTADTVVLRHPSGHEIETCAVAGAKSGSSLVSRWSAGIIFDEAPRMNGEEDGIINFDEARRAGLGRLLPGAQLIAIGSPWAPRGPMFEAVQQFWRKPTPALVVIKAPAPAMNPVWWTPERIAALRAQPNGDLIYQTDVRAEFADPVSSLFSSVEIMRATRKDGPAALPYERGATYAAAMDPGTRGNAWTLVVTRSLERPDGTTREIVVLAQQWVGSRADPLSPDFVLQQIAAIVWRYRVESVWTDQLAADFIKDIARRYDVNVEVEPTTAADKTEMFESLRARIADGGVELPDDPAVRADLLAIRKVVTRNGIGIELPRTADGRHCDYAPALALVVSKGASGAAGPPDWAKPEFIAAVHAMAGGRGPAPGMRGEPLVFVTHATGMHELRGNTEKFANMRVLFSHANDPGQFNAEPSSEFERAVSVYRSQNNV